MDIVNRIVQIYDSFVALPLESQIVMGVGALVVVAAVRNIWGVLFPVRFAIAYALRGGAFILHPRRRRYKPAQVVDETSPPWDLTSQGKLKQLLDYYSKNDRVTQLSYKQLMQLSNARKLFDAYNCYFHSKGRQIIHDEINRRDNHARLLKIANETIDDSPPRVCGKETSKVDNFQPTTGDVIS